MALKRQAQQSLVSAKKPKTVAPAKRAKVTIPTSPAPKPSDKTLAALQKLMPKRSVPALKPVAAWLEKECNVMTFADLEGAEAWSEEVMALLANDTSVGIGVKGLVKELMRVLTERAGTVTEEAYEPEDVQEDDELEEDEVAEEKDPFEEEDQQEEDYVEEEEFEELLPKRAVAAKMKALAKPVASGPLVGLKKSSAVAAMRQAVAEGRPAPGADRLQKSRAAAKAALSRPFTRVFLEEPPELDEEQLELVEDARAEMEVTVESEIGKHFAPVATFDELGVFPGYVLEAIEANGWETPLPIQAQALPLVLAGHDVTGIAKTGSGKTLAYLLPAVVHIEAQDPVDTGTATPIALCLAPTRELVVQIAEEARKLVGHSRDASNHPGGIGAACVYGGKSKFDQLRQCKQGCHILAATPGRLMDHVQSAEIPLSRVTYFVLDEADRMLEEGFSEQLRTIAQHVRADRHMLFFSATWPRQVENLARDMCKGREKPVHLAVGQRQDGLATTRADILQEVVVFNQASWEQRDAAKKELLYGHVREVLAEEGNKCLVFVSSKNLANDLRNSMWAEGFQTDAMHGGRSQDQRLNVLAGFKRGETRLLVCTDVMGRGLDIPDISHVVIYDMGEIEDYVHRIGRTARGPSGQGHALTFFEFDRKWPHLASGLIQVLEAAEQEVPDELRDIAQQVGVHGTYRPGMSKRYGCFEL